MKMKTGLYDEKEKAKHLHLDEAGHRHEQVSHSHGGGCRPPGNKKLVKTKFGGKDTSVLK